MLVIGIIGIPLSYLIASGEYVLGDVGVDGCPGGYQGIFDADLCETASAALSLTYDGSQNDGIDTAECNWCGGCDPQTVRVSDSHGGSARWLCVLSNGTLVVVSSQMHQSFA